MKKFLSIILASLAVTSCVDTVILPDNKTVDEDFWQKKSEVNALVATAYAQLRDASAIRSMVVWGDFRSDEMVLSTSLPLSADYKVDLQQIYSFNVVTENEFTKWAPFYSAINYCNLVLEKAEQVMANDPDYMQGDYDANKAQVLALRAYCYFYLTRVFHDIPVTPHAYLNSSDDLNAEQQAPATVLEMCISDLEEASKYAISGSLYTGDDAWRNKGYMTIDAINALLADIYLWRASVNRDAADYQACVDYCDKVIQAKKLAYESQPKKGGWGDDVEEKDYYLSAYNEMYEDIWGQNGQNAEESIFELQFNNSGVENTGLDQMYFRYNNKTTSNTGYLVATKLFSTVDGGGKGVWANSDDHRLYEFFYNANNTSADQFGVRKFVAPITRGTDKSGESKPSNSTGIRSDFKQNWIIYRLTDVMLMKAEALVQLYELGGKAAEDTRNEDAFNICKFVNSRGLADADVASKSLAYVVYKDRMEELVLLERSRELCFEGKRWFDLMRYNYRHTEVKADLTKKLSESYVKNSTAFFDLALRKYAVPTSMKAKMLDERYLYMPINQDEIEVNPNLTQNPVYESSAKY